MAAAQNAPNARLEHLLAQTNTLADRVAQIDENLEKITQIVEKFGERQRKLLDWIAEEHQQSEKNCHKRKREGTSNNLSISRALAQL